MFEGPEERRRPGEQVACFAGVVEREITPDQMGSLCNVCGTGGQSRAACMYGLIGMGLKDCGLRLGLLLYLADQLCSSTQIIHEVDSAVVVGACVPE
jgi:hypothetical protein